MDINDVTFGLLKRLLTAKFEGDIVCDGAKIIQTIRKQPSTGPSTIYEYRFSFDENGCLHMQASVWPDVPSLDEQKSLVGTLDETLKLICDACPYKGSERCKTEPIQTFKFTDGKISYAAPPVQLGPEPDMERAFEQCFQFENMFIETVNEMLKTVMNASVSALIIIGLGDLPPGSDPTPGSNGTAN